MARLTSLPCLPFDFANSVASDSLIQVVRTMTEAATNETITFLVKLVQESLEECKDFWDPINEQSKFLSLVEFDGKIFSVALYIGDIESPGLAGKEEEANKRFRKIITLQTRISLLSDIYATAGYAHTRASQTLLHVMLGRSPSPLADLGALHRSFVWENIALKSALSAQGIDVAPPSHELFSSILASSTQAGQHSSTPTVEDAAAGSVGTAAPAANGASAGEPSTSAGTPATKKEERPQDKNARALKHLAHQIPASLTPFFQCMSTRSFHIDYPLIGRL